MGKHKKKKGKYLDDEGNIDISKFNLPMRRCIVYQDQSFKTILAHIENGTIKCGKYARKIKPIDEKISLKELF